MTEPANVDRAGEPDRVHRAARVTCTGSERGAGT